MTEYFIRHPEKEYLFSYIMPYDLLANSDTLNNNYIGQGDEILFIGYPSFLYDKRNISPIVRTGIIATSPKEDYYFSDEYRMGFYSKFGQMLPKKLSGFLIDANIVGSSSGSLVMSKPLFFRITKDGSMEYTKNPNGIFYILGIVTESYFDLDSRVSGAQRVNLGGVISAQQIIKTINLFL